MQVCAATSSDEVERLYKAYIELPMKKGPTQETIVMGDINAEEKKGEEAINNYCIYFQNNRGEMLAEFTERNQLHLLPKA